MRTPPPLSLDDLLRESDSPPEPGYDDWKQAKIERALEESRDPSNLIDADIVWRELGLET